MLVDGARFAKLPLVVRHIRAGVQVDGVDRRSGQLVDLRLRMVSILPQTRVIVLVVRRALAVAPAAAQRIYICIGEHGEPSKVSSDVI